MTSDRMQDAPLRLPAKSNLSDETTKHDDWRVALYYYYVDLGDVGNVAKQIEFHRNLCISLDLKGRVRVSSEGINGVLTGLFESLQLYESSFRKELERLASVDSSSSSSSDGYIDDLDIKYCELRPELSIQSQLFDTLMVKETDQVVSLFENDETTTSNGGGGVPKNKNRRSKQSNRRQRRKEQKRQQEEEELTPEQQAERDELREIQREFLACTTPAATDNSSSSNDAEPTSLVSPAIHLSADEWNSKLSQSRSDKKKAMLLDVRNVYESRVGHFAVPDVPTMLTNTRKYSDLPRMVLQNKHHFEDKEEVFMYCTGGVRCERFSVLLQSMYPQTTFYQLKGGIQTYLKEAQQQQDEIPQQDEIQPGGEVQQPIVQERTGDDNASSTSKEYYYRGKNFVFDPRRTDPLQVPGMQNQVVGTCLVCHVPHDDYDNGHAPCENCEARCINCRMLILVCNTCRPKYVCWGDEKKGETNNKDDRPTLYCGMDHCIHEGNAPEPEFVTI